MILIVNLNDEEFAYDEFILPIKRIVGKCDVKHYKEVKNVKKYDKIILSGTSLIEKRYLDHDFSWIKEFEGKILGICAGMQVIAMIHDCKLKKCTEIGMYNIKVFTPNKLESEDFEAYCLHNYAVEPNDKFDELFGTKKCTQGIKLKGKEVYGVLFHPEVRNQSIINWFKES
ncbi:hypothetical protein HOD38_03465 [archaeon]|jgi:GMP synthase-like glutamine amidotransferase|nr:hypothetical protein [archaeon]MBT4397299.1 hypothetical protein [archaeon]MBT4440679.1 hypothetical protein [archaeon]